MIGIALDRDVVGAGEFLTGTAQWSAEGDRVARQLIIAIEWCTDGAGNRASGIARGAVFPLGGRTQGSFLFRLLIPYEGPVTFTGELVSVSWKIRVRADLRGFDESVEGDFRVVARGGGGRPTSLRQVHIPEHE